MAGDFETERPSERVEDLPWARWGAPRALPQAALDLLRSAFTLPDEGAPPPPERIGLTESRLPEGARAAFAGALGAEWVRTGDTARLGHAGGQSTTDLLRRRAGDASDAADAVLLPGDVGEVAAVLRVAEEHGVAVVPYGGATSVVGGLGGLPGEHGAVVALDLRRFDGMSDLDLVSMTATLEAGLRAPEAEELLRRHGMTLGHVPQSFEHATIGGFAATRSAGQASAEYGRFDAMVTALTVVTPRGTLRLGRAPASAAGPDLRQLFLGGEGALGVITDVTVRIRPVPEVLVDEAWSVPDLGTGVTALRRLAQAGALPAVARLSDELETAIMGSVAGPKPPPGCQVVTCYEGTAEAVRARRAAAHRVLSEAGATPLGAEPVAGWREGRFSAPYLRDTLLDAGVLAETLETATSWRRLPELYAAVRDALTAALTAAGTPPIVMAHVSHAYPDGASLYYTVLAAQATDPIAQWAAAKRAAGDAIVAGGGTITHHHAVGADHLPWMRAETGELGAEVLRAVKRTVDPRGVLNPGKLIP